MPARQAQGKRKIIVLEFITLDGVIQAPGGPTEDTSGGFKYGGWTVPYFDEFTGKVMSKQMMQPFDLLLGRKTYEIFASYWPQRESDWPGINQATKYVVARGKMKTAWGNSVVVTGPVVAVIKKLKANPPTGGGPPLQVYGSGNLVQTLLKHDLVDELWLKIFPITLGTGKRLFAAGTIPAAFKLTDSKISPKGVIIANYERAGKVATGSF